MLSSGHRTASKDAQLKTFSRRLTDCTSAMVDNYAAIVTGLKVEDDSRLTSTNQAFQDNYEVSVRCTNILKAGESLINLISDLKECLIFQDFPSLNASLSQQKASLTDSKSSMVTEGTRCRDMLLLLLYEMEQEYYSDSYR